MLKIVSVCKGGGYHYARTTPLHPKANSNGLYPLHRVIVENSLGKFLTPNEVVHHMDGNKDNNELSNLIVLTRSEHSKEHKQPVDDIESICPSCSRKVFLKPGQHRARLRRNQNSIIYCSVRCARKFQLSQGR